MRSFGLAVAALALGFGVQAASAQETRLLFTSLSPAGSPNSQFFNSWAQRVNDQSGGALKIEVRDGIREGDQVILNPPVDLVEGKKVQVRPSDAKA